MKINSPAPRFLFLFLIVSGVILLFAGGCHKRVAIAPSAPPPAPAVTAVPTVALQASPADITRGESTRLTWSSTNATQLTLSPGLGSVNGQGSLQVSPTDSTTYTITGMGDGGRAEASTRVTVSMPPAAAIPSPNLEELFQVSVKDAFFDYNTADIRSDARESLLKDAEFLRLHSEIHFAIEGHCDERGSEEYNLGLGDRRATSAKKYLVSLGIADDRIQTTSYGKERPFCTEHDEGCWQQNRRAHFAMIR
jgi:peptidoglycan-associated lipoprotein